MATAQKEAFIADLGIELYGPSPDIRKLSGLSRRLKKFGCTIIDKTYPASGRKASFVTDLDKLPENWKEVFKASKRIVSPTEEKKEVPPVIKEPETFLERLALVLDRTLAKNEELVDENKLLWEENIKLTHKSSNQQATIDQLLAENQALQKFKDLVASEVPELSERVAKALVGPNEEED